MQALLTQISQAALQLDEMDFSNQQREAEWIGQTGATTADIEAAEARLNVKLPADYRQFLEISNGFGAATSVEPHFLPVASIDLLKNQDAELIEIWRETGNEEVAAELERSICVAGVGEEQQFLLIPPATAGGAWQYWKFAHWIPGEEAFQDLEDYFESVLEFVEEELAAAIDSSARKVAAQAYIDHLSNGDLTSLLGLFAEDASVVSPVYGTKHCKAFYTELFADTKESQLQVKGIFEDADTGHLALYFTYHWTLKNNSKVSFDVVDILEFDENDNIQKLIIIYDTVLSRRLVGEL